MRMFLEPPAVYLHREPVDFRHYAPFTVMRCFRWGSGVLLGL